jgi:hypothetical protein
MILVQKFPCTSMWEYWSVGPCIWVHLGGSRRNGIGQGGTPPNDLAIPIQGVSVRFQEKQFTPMQEVLYYGMVGLNISLPGALFLVLLICSLKGY